MPHGLAPELARLDRLIEREIRRLRATYEISLDEFRGLFISDEQVDVLVRARHGEPEPTGPPPPPRAGTAWATLVERFGLDTAAREVLLLAVAPELDRKYAPLFAYLNNEATRSWPTPDLAGRLLGDVAAAWQGLDGLAQAGLVELLPDPTRRTQAAQAFAACPEIVRFLLGLDPAAVPELRLHAAEAGECGPLARVPALADAPAPLLLLEGAPGSLRLPATRALAYLLGRCVLEADLAASTRPAAEVLQAASVLARLRAAIPFVRGIEQLPASGGLASALAALPRPALLAVPTGLPLPVLAGCEALRIPWPQPDAAARRTLWASALAGANHAATPAALAVLAERFRLTPAQIGRAARAAAAAHALDVGGNGPIPPARLFRAAREQSDDRLGGLATRINRAVAWDELVLPPPTLERLREAASAIAHRGLVQREWGMGRLSLSPDGLAVLFQGASGTGKTMAASAIADELGLDLYRIDLAGVVSKYIGETEKNIDRIFSAARNGNAILLFDEADALFGKRSDVKDAHDRYANVEVAYLLQRMEEHDGPVILATNLAKNIDQAFARRLHYIIEFPRPGAPARADLWRQMLAPPLPCAADVDLDHLSRMFDLTGGEIRKVALEAAFLAASNGRIVTMAQLLAASGREVQRQGRVMPAAGRPA